MRNEYGSVEGEFKNTSELHQPKDNLGIIQSEFLENKDEYWKESTEYVEENQKILSSEKDVQEKKKKENRRRHKILNKMVYAVASAAMVVTISQTIEVPQYIGDTIIFEGVGVLTEEQVDARLEAQPPRGSFRVIIGEGYTEVGQRAFDGMDDLIDISFPNSLDTIGSYAFNGCSGITEMVIPDSVKTIGHNAFSNCNNMVIDQLTTAERSIGIHAFGEVTIKEVVISESYKPENGNVLWSAKLEQVSFEEGIRRIPANVLNGCGMITELIIPESVTEIGAYAFGGCSGLTEMVIPESVTTIGHRAFDGCDNMVIDQLLTAGRSIGIHAFGEVTIKEVVISESYKPENGNVLWSAKLEKVSFEAGIRRIPANVLNGCGMITELIIPESVTEIGAYAFGGCSGLTEMVIPESVTTIGHRAFDGCDNLVIITSSDTVAEKYAVEEKMPYVIR